MLSSEMDADDEHVETNAKRRTLTTNGAILDCFWKLASYNGRERAATTLKLVDLLKKAQGDEKEPCDNLIYSVGRLVKGLSSNRKAARLGFYVALVELFRSFAQLDVKFIRKLIDKNLLPGDNTNASPIQLAIGRTVAYASLIRSAKIEKDGEFIEEIAGYLAGQCFPKSQLSTFCATLLVEIISTVDGENFLTYVWPKLGEIFATGWVECTQDILYLLFCCRNRFPKIISKKFLQNHFGCKEIIGAETVHEVRSVLAQSVEECPTLHPVWTQIVETTVNLKTDIFNQFWKAVFDESCFKNIKPLFLAFEVLNVLVPKLTTPHQISTVLSPHLMKEFIKQLSHKELQLHKASQRLLLSIETFVKDANADCQLAIVAKLIQEPGSILIDHIVVSKPVQTMSAMLCEEAVIGLSVLLKEIFMAQNSRNVSHSVREMALKKLAQLVGQRNMLRNFQWRVEVLQFMALHAFFEVQTVSKKLPHCDKKPAAVSSSLRVTAQAAFFKALSTLPTLHTSGNISTLQTHFSMLHSVLLFVGELVKSPIVSNLQSWDEKTFRVWKKLLESVRNLTARAEQDGRSSESHAFQVLFLHMALQLFVLPEKACGAIEELEICNSKAMDSRNTLKRKSSSEDEPKWSEVVLDLLLGLLSENKSFLRMVVDNVFSLLLPFVPHAALEHILKLIDPEIADESILEENDSEDSDSPVDDDEAETESETASSNMDNQSVDDLRASVEAALGNAVGNSDDETYLDDDAMENLDDALSEAFRSMSSRPHKSNNKLEEALLHFRHRCVDLLNIVVTTNPTLPTAVHLILPLVSTVESCCKDKTLVQLTNRVSACLRKLVNLKKFNIDCDENLYPACRETLINSTRSMIKRSYRVTNIEFNKLVSEVFVFLYRCAVQLDKHNDNELMVDAIADILNQALVDFLGQRGMRVHQTIFFALLKHYKELGWKLCPTIQKYTFNSNTRLFMQTTALSMLNIITSQANIVDEQQWTQFSESNTKNIEDAVQDLSKKDMKPKYLMELLALWRNISKINTTLNHEVTISPKTQMAIQTLGSVPKSQKKIINYIFRLAKVPQPTALKTERDPNAPPKRQKKRRKRAFNEDESMETEVVNETPSPKKPRIEQEPSPAKRHKKRKSTAL